MKQYLKKRRMMALAVLALGILVAFLLIVSSPSKEKPFISVVENGNGEPSGYQTGGVRGFSNLNPLGGTSDTARKNLTQELAQNYVESVYNINNENPTDTTDTLRMPASGSMSGFLTQALSQDLTFPSFTEKDIYVGADNSQGGQVSYIKKISDISKKNFGEFKTPITTVLNNFINNNDPSQLKRYINIIGNQINDLLALEVPPQLGAWHLQNLNLWRKKFAVFSMIFDYKSDPLKAALASQEVPRLMKETASVDKIINVFASSL